MSKHYELPIASFLAIVLLLLPLPWHWKARNVATLSMIAWLVIINLLRGINTIVWIDNVRVHDRWWCDITTKLSIGVVSALPACSLCITRNLEHIAATRVAISTAADKRRRRIVDLCITGIPPLLTMILHYVVQGHRFDVMEVTGCQPAIYYSVPALFIIFIPPIVLSMCSFIYAALALRHFIRRRSEFERHLRDSQSALNTSRYMRLMALAVTEMLWGTPLGIYTAVFNFRRNGFRPYTSWADVHYNFSRIPVWSAFLLSKDDMFQNLLIWWFTPASAILFFLFFGFSEEALEGYAAAIRWVRRVVFRQRLPPSSSSYSKGQSMPRFTPVRASSKLVSASNPDDICLDFPDLPFDGTTMNRSDGREVTAKEDVETSSTMSLTLPGHELFASEPFTHLSPHQRVSTTPFALDDTITETSPSF